VSQGSAAALQHELTELASLETPPGVDEALFEQLKSALAVQLRWRFGAGEAAPSRSLNLAKLSSTPPSGPANHVDDLSVTDNDDGTYTLSWTYLNQGDYNQDGVVNVMDITPLAAHFNEESGPENEWVDGNGDGTINIQDLTTLAAKFQVSVGAYRLEGAPAEDGPFSQFVSVSVEGECPPGRRRMSYLMTGIPHAFIRVVPCDRQGHEGEPSNALALDGEAPVVAGVTPLAGEPGEQLTMHATVTGTEPLSYLWDFDGAGNPHSSPAAEPDIILGDCDEYDCSLQVSNAFGEAVFPFKFIVAAELFSISGRIAEGVTGVAGVSVILSPSDTAVLTESNGLFRFSRLLRGTYTLTPFHPDYTFDPLSREVELMEADATGQDFAATAKTFSVSGTVTFNGGTPFPDVRITLDPAGGTQLTDDEGEFTFADIRNGTYTITPSKYGYEFTPPWVQFTVAGSDRADIDFTGQLIPWYVITVDPGPNNGLSTNLRMVDGRPAISCFQSTGDTGNLRFAINRQADGTGLWDVTTIVSNVLQAHSLAVIDGNPAVCYYTSASFAPDPLHFARNTSPDGSGSWISYTVVSDVAIGVGASLFEVDGRPAIAYYNMVDAANGSLRFAICENSDGSGSWTITEVDAAGHVGAYPFLTMLDSTPAIAYYDLTNRDLKLALNDQPDASGNWHIQVPYSIGNVGASPSMAMVDGRPAISFLDSGGKSLKYVINTQADALGQWQKVTVDYQGNVGSYASLAVVGGLPAISYYDTTNGGLKYAEAATADGSSPEAWTRWLIDSAGNVGTYTSLMEVDGRPAISYRDVTTGALKFAIRPY